MSHLLQDRARGAPVRRARAYLALLVVAAAGAASGCRASSPGQASIPRELRERFDAGRRLEEQGLDAEALVIYREVVAVEPRFIAAQRALQNLEVAQHRRGELLVRQRARLDAASGSAE